MHPQQRTDTAALLAAGRGGGRHPATAATPKCMLELLDRPAIQYIVEQLMAAGIRRFIIVDSPRNRGLIQEHLLETIPGIDLVTVYQTQSRGTGAALRCIEGVVERQSFVVVLPDNLVGRQDLPDMIGLHQIYGGTVLALGEVPPHKMSMYGIAEVTPREEKGFFDTRNVFDIHRVVEKPRTEEETPPGGFGFTGWGIFHSGIFDAVRRTPPRRTSPDRREEILLIDSLQLLLDDGDPCTGMLTRQWEDIGTSGGNLMAELDRAFRIPALAAELRPFLRSRLMGDLRTAIDEALDDPELAAELRGFLRSRIDPG